ncbi:MAG: hypothetical protein RBT11_04545 [Desulfobacterales bacterium]|nr:hypothetical protein [Desulfobacterales bacterium]
MNRSKLLYLAVFILICCFSTAWADKGKDESGKGKKQSPSSDYGQNKGRDAYKDDHHDSMRTNENDTYFHRRGYTRLNIPKGHYPPPGKCRVWFPGQPPGQQPPPGDCHHLNVPPGAWLIRHPVDRPDHCHVTVYDDDRPGSIVITGEFEIPTGGFVRVVLDK